MLEDLARWAAEAAPADLWADIGLSILAALPTLFVAFWFLRKARAMEDMATSRIRSAAQGYVEIEGIGRLIPGPEIVSPLTGLPCLWWAYSIDRRGSVGKIRSSKWRNVASHSSSSSFEIDDGTGKVVVYPAGAKVVAHESDFWFGDSASWTGPPATGDLNQMTGNHRFFEQRLVRDRPIYGLGWFKTLAGVNVFCTPPKHHGGSFVLSGTLQAALVSRYRTTALAFAVLSLVGGAITAWVLGTR